MDWGFFFAAQARLKPAILLKQTIAGIALGKACRSSACLKSKQAFFSAWRSAKSFPRNQ